MKLAQRTFTFSDQKLFASISGDHNPIHVDPLAAPRTSAGAPVVHGIHLLLWALDSLAAAQPELPTISGLRIQFSRFVYLDESVDLLITQQTPSRIRLNISANNVLRSKLTIDFGDPGQNSPESSLASLELIPFSPTPLNLDFTQISALSGRLAFLMTSQNATAIFPSATRWLGAARIAALAASTHLVGMICPGMHSIYSELSIQTCAESLPQDSLAFRVTEADPRFSSVQMAIAGGGLTGIVESSARTPPVSQPAMESIAGLVAPTDFAGSLALIVGGSRGLGELTAKLVASGGARVVITYQAGKNDAEKVAQEIRSAGGLCEILPYDVRKPAAEQLASLKDAPTHLYYFATPTIFRHQSEIFSPGRLKEFMAFFVDGFWQLSEVLRLRQPSLSIFYPSTVFVTERPAGMTEYAMAKAAGEHLCADMNASLSPAHVTVSRLPRLLTDQTASVTALETADPLQTILPIIREVHSWPK